MPKTIHKVIHSGLARMRQRPIRGRLAAVATLILVSVVAVSDEVAAPTAGDALDLVGRANAGSAWDQLNLGAAYDHGLAGFPRDPARAVFWYRRAAETGLAEAQFNLAHCLVMGQGVARDDVEALSWMLKAAAQGLADAQFLTGVMFAEGVGAPADPVRATRWLERAARNGNADAAALLRRNAEPSAEDQAIGR